MRTPVGTASAALALAVLCPAAACAHDDDRTLRDLTGEFATAGVRRVELRLPPGSVRIEPSPDGRVRVELDVRCPFDDERCEERAREMRLESSRPGSTLRIEVERPFRLSALRLNVRGRVLVPPDRALGVDLPAGELAIRGVRDDLDVDVGAGEVTIALREADVRSVRLGVAIGEATLSVAGRRIEGWGVLAPKVRWNEGHGPSRVEVSLGVGELTLKLD